MKTNENKLTGVFEMRNNESSENYLETILVLSKRLPVVRSVDIANELGFKKSSVSVELDVSTSDASVDMDAESTRITTSAISTGESPDSMVGIMESNPLASMSI